MEFKDMRELDDYCTDLVFEKKEMDNYYICENADKLRIVLNVLFEQLLGTNDFLNTEIRTVKVNGSFAYIVSNNKFGFDYLVELLENLDENKEEN